jgi:group I intron endonuclease
MNMHSSNDDYEKDGYTVYMHIAPNGKKYVGITGNDVKVRWQNGTGYKRNKHFWNAITKYGWENIEHIILYTNISKDKACEIEKELIAKYNTRNSQFGYNNSIGGEYGTLGARLSEETRRKMSESRKGEKNSFYGKHHTDEARAKNSIAHKCQIGCWKGKRLTEEHRQKIKENHADLSGGKSPRAKPVICIETGEVYEAISVASKTTGICDDSISKVCKGITKTAGGYHWMFAKEMSFNV